MAPIHWAVHRQDIEEVQTLVGKDAEVVHQKTQDQGMTPLHMAALRGNAEIVRFLLDHGAKVDELDQQGFTSLYGACDRGSAEVVELLLSKGADPHTHVRNRPGSTALARAAAGGHAHVVQLLLSRTKFDEDDLRHALSRACAEGCVSPARCLLLWGADWTRGILVRSVATGGVRACMKLLEEAWRAYMLFKARSLHDDMQSRLRRQGRQWKAPRHLKARARQRKPMPLLVVRTHSFPDTRPPTHAHSSNAPPGAWCGHDGTAEGSCAYGGGGGRPPTPSSSSSSSSSAPLPTSAASLLGHSSLKRRRNRFDVDPSSASLGVSGYGGMMSHTSRGGVGGGSVYGVNVGGGSVGATQRTYTPPYDRSVVAATAEVVVTRLPKELFRELMDAMGRTAAYDVGGVL